MAVKIKVFEQGWVCQQKSSLDFWGERKDPWEVALYHMISLALAFKDYEQKVRVGPPIKIKKGQCLVSKRAMSEMTGWSKNQCLKILKQIENKGLIKCESLGQNGTLVTFVDTTVARKRKSEAPTEAANSDLGHYQDPPKRKKVSNSGPSSEAANQANGAPSSGPQKNSLLLSQETTVEEETTKVQSGQKRRQQKGSKILWDLWRECCPSLGQINKLTDTRQRAANARWREEPSEDYWREVFRKMEASAFCRGEVKDWKARFDWAMRPDTHVKTMEGLYDDKKGPKLQANTRGWQRENGPEELSESQKEVLRKRRPTLPHEYMGAQPNETKRPGADDPGGDAGRPQGHDQLGQVASGASGVVQDRGV